MSETQHCNDAGLAIIKGDEKCRLEAYRDGGGVLTIGWGHTGPEVIEGLTWTQEQADAQLKLDIVDRAEKPVDILVNYELTSNQFSALVSFVFNIGWGNFERSSALILLNQGDFEAVGPHMALWDKDHRGNVENGLTARRAKEIALFYTQEADNYGSA